MKSWDNLLPPSDTHVVRAAEKRGLDKRYLADIVGRVRAGEIALVQVSECGLHRNTHTPELPFKAVAFSAIPHIFPILFRVSISPSLF